MAFGLLPKIIERLQEAKQAHRFDAGSGNLRIGRLSSFIALQAGGKVGRHRMATGQFTVDPIPIPTQETGPVFRGRTRFLE